MGHGSVGRGSWIWASRSSELLESRNAWVRTGPSRSQGVRKRSGWVRQEAVVQELKEMLYLRAFSLAGARPPGQAQTRPLLGRSTNTWHARRTEKGRSRRDRPASPSSFERLSLFLGDADEDHALRAAELLATPGGNIVSALDRHKMHCGNPALLSQVLVGALPQGRRQQRVATPGDREVDQLPRSLQGRDVAVEVGTV